MLKSLPRGAGLFGALILLIVISSFISPHFLNPINLLNVLRQVAMFGILGIGMTFVILTKGIDLSVGSTVAFTGVMGAVLMGAGFPIWVSMIACLALGAVIGAANGLGVGVGGERATEMPPRRPAPPDLVHISYFHIFIFSYFHISYFIFSYFHIFIFLYFHIFIFSYFNI